MQTFSKIRTNSFAAGPRSNILYWMRRRNASSPSLVRAQVGREDQEGLKRHRHLAAGLEAQIIDVPLHRHNPAIQDFGRGRALAAEVVDQVDAVVGLQLERRVVDLGVLVVAQIQHVQRQLAAGDDEGALAADPAAVVRQAPVAERADQRRLFVLDAGDRSGSNTLDDVALAFDGVGHEDGTASRLLSDSMR